jgi:hypothetical protein
VTDQRACCYCGNSQGLRPYGPAGAWVCFPCAMATPERVAEAHRNFDAQLEAAGPVVVIGEETGPRPLGDSRGRN